MKNGVTYAVAGATLALYVGVIAVGARLGPWALDYGWHTGPKVEAWRMARAEWGERGQGGGD